MTDFVQLYWKRNRGWPWPEESWGLTPMFGEDGWCHACGVPSGPQTGSVVLQRKGFRLVEGSWVPNWRFDVICVDATISDYVAKKFDLDLRPVDWHPAPPGAAMQIVVPTLGNLWFDHDELRAKAIEFHGVPGATCPECGVWRWMPLTFGFLPPLRITPALGENVNIAASPEWFGDGWRAFRQIIVRRELAEIIAAASPRDFKVQPLS